jgi:hypothetical protein
MTSKPGALPSPRSTAISGPGGTPSAFSGTQTSLFRSMMTWSGPNARGWVLDPGVPCARTRLRGMSSSARMAAATIRCLGHAWWAGDGSVCITILLSHTRGVERRVMV